MKQKIIIIITHRFYPIIGGAENQALLLARNLVLRGNNVQVLTSRVNNSSRHEIIDGITVIRFNKYNIDRNFLFFILLFNFKILFYLCFRLYQFEKVLYFFGLDFFSFSAFPLKWLGKETMIRTATPSASEIGGNFKNAKYYKYRRYLLSAFCKFIAITNTIKSNLLNEGIKPSQILKMNNGVDASLFYPICNEERIRLRKLLNLSEKKIYILFCGHFYKTKGLDFLINSLIELGKSKQFSDVELLILGGSQSISNKDSLEEEINNLISQQYLPIQINFLGQVYDREKYFQAANIFILPSQSEGMPNALLEAMACGLACIATNVGGVLDVILHRKNGLVVEYGNLVELGNVIYELANDNCLRNNIGNQAQLLIKNQYRIDIVAMEYEAILKQYV
jgi:glycosyltransferase involved in cell wall biosynthesis